MKYIVKDQEPEGLLNWKTLATQEQKTDFEAIPGKVKRLVKQSLMDEQGHLCCYCERRIEDDDSHIEHFCPRSDESVDPLDYKNLLCSCQKRLKSGEPRHCGVLKDEWFDKKLLISPLSSDCETRFTYTADGGISGTNEAAMETIKRLGLYISKLTSLREKAIAPFLDEEINNTDFINFVAGYLRKDKKGRFAEFFTTIQYLFGETKSKRK
jgi:uncharacterized protein (TIGR02646 family)